MNTTRRFRLSATVLDSLDANALAHFYARLLGWEVKAEEPGWVMLANPDGGAGLSFATNATYVPPVWPAAEGDQQMSMHLDIGVDTLDATSNYAQSLGATVAEFQPQDDVRVHLDPAGHPFCLFLQGAS
jgi:catechol 2,3-dioxygenase-like lactoylglutathione lyase family enzyme